MAGRGTTRAVLCAGLVVAALVTAGPAGAQPPADLSDDGTGKRWRQLTETVGLRWDEVVQVCPRDGETPCSGGVGGNDLTGWVWATAGQVVAVMGLYDAAILTADPPDASGPDHFGLAYEFLEEMRPTFSVTGYNFHHSSTGGWTSSSDEAGTPVAASAGYGWYPISGGFAVYAAADELNPHRGVWLWRPSAEDITPPLITPTVSGSLGCNGWYVSDVAVTWAVEDAESEVSSRSGCDAETVASDDRGVVHVPGVVVGRDLGRFGGGHAGCDPADCGVPFTAPGVRAVPVGCLGAGHRHGRDVRAGEPGRAGDDDGEHQCCRHVHADHRRL